MTEFSTLRPKSYRYLTDDNDENEKGKIQSVCYKTKTLIWRFKKFYKNSSAWKRTEYLAKINFLEIV